MNSAFSLVELSIVLVILGLLTGGILAGQSLIRASELRAVSNESQRYVTAVHAFRDKYFALPGDMENATSFWGSAGGNGADDTCYATASSTTTCNGNGNRQIHENGGTTRPEMFRAWQHLANAGLIEGAYNGIVGVQGWEDAEPGRNTPVSKLRNAGWHLSWLGRQATGVTYFAGNYGNALFFGDGSGLGVTSRPVMKPEEAWNVDMKVDDGRPAHGRVTTYTALSPNCASTTDPATAEYVLTSSAIACALLLKTGF